MQNWQRSHSFLLGWLAAPPKISDLLVLSGVMEPEKTKGPEMKNLFALLISLIPVTVNAQDGETLLQAAIHARINGQPNQALEILNQLEAENTRNPRVKFEKGIALASNGQCAAAARTFNAGKELTPTPSFRTASQDAMDDLCPRLARLETNLTASLIHETNQNSGSESEVIIINGLSFVLSEDAIARAGSKFTLSGSGSYNVPLSYRSYIVPGVSLNASLHEYSEYNQITPQVSLSYRYRGDHNDIRFGPFLGLNYGSDALKTRDKGISLNGRLSLNTVSSLNYAASISLREHVGYNVEPDLNKSASLSYVRAIRDGKNILTLGVSFYDTQAENYMSNAGQATLTASLTGTINTSFGYEVYGAHTISKSDGVDPIFGIRREDNISEIGARISLPIAETFLGRPFVGITYVNSSSTFDTKNFNNARATFGITRRF
jgi:hypothetical protein